MKRVIAFILMFAVVNFNLQAQEEFVAPQAKLITKFSFTQLTGGIIIIAATLDEHKDSLHFVLDTGSSGISLDSSTSSNLNLIVVETNRVIRGIAGMKKVPFTYNHFLNLPGLKVDSLHFHVVDYELLSSVYGIKIDGIIGFSFLRRYIIKLDYNKNIIEVHSPGLIKYPKKGYMIKPNFTSLPLSTFTIEDAVENTSKFIFDTGAGLCFLLNSDFIEDSALLKKKKKKYLTQTEGMGGKKKMEITTVKKVTIGPYKLRNVPVYIFDDEFNVCSYPQLSGLIGNDILRRFNVILNYPDQTIFLKPNDRFYESFDYSYTGLSIYLINNEITVTDIVPDSPGDNAGFKTGDVILGVDNAFTKNIQVVKAALQNAGADLKVMVLRNNSPILLKLKVKNILN